MYYVLIGVCMYMCMPTCKHVHIHVNVNVCHFNFQYLCVYTYPQAVTVMTALTLARDEVYWLFKHNSVPPPKGKHRPVPDDYSDPALPELLFLIMQLKGMINSQPL